MIGTTPTRAKAKPEYLAPYQPYPWQVAFWQDKTKVILLTGTAGGGKSRAGLEKLNGFMLKYPGATGLMLRKAREYALKSLVPMMRYSVQGSDPSIRMLKSETCFLYPNESVLYWGGMKNEEQRQAIRSIGGHGALDFILVEEANAFTEDDKNELMARLRGTAAPWRQIVFMTNPDDPGHWIYKLLIEDGRAKVYYSSFRDNPANPADYEETLNEITGALGERLREGRWVRAEGGVYGEYRPETHVVEWFEPPADWRRIRSIDFGYTNPFVCQWWAVDGDGRMYLYRELYMSRRLVSEHAVEINRLTGDELIEATVADHDAEDRATLEAAGIVTLAAQKEISVGIQAVQQRLKVAGDGKARLFFMTGALVEEDAQLGAKPRSTLAELPGYIWTKEREGTSLKEVPLKINDHGMDAMRYAVMYLEHYHHGIWL